MITYFLGDEEVAAYCRDLVSRLTRLKGDFPTQWFALGNSGLVLAEVLLKQLPRETLKKITLGEVYYQRGTGQLKFATPLKGVKFTERPILVLDSAVHSGKSMLKLIERLQKAGAKNIISYTLVLKRSSHIVPTYFGVVIDDKDRCYFQLDELPNNRLNEKPPFGVLRELTENDVSLVVGDIGPPFQSLTLGDLIYDVSTGIAKAYIYEVAGEIAGFSSFRKIGHTLFIDAWGTTQKFRGKGIGSALMRWTETWARTNHCNRIELWAYESAIPTYEYYKYDYVDEKWRVLGKTERYKVMQRKILYNLRRDGTETSS